MKTVSMMLRGALGLVNLLLLPVLGAQAGGRLEVDRVLKPQDYGIEAINFGDGLAMDGDQIAIWQTRGQGQVHVFQGVRGGPFSKRCTFLPPDTVYDEPFFGIAMGLQGDVLFVGSILTIRLAVHEGTGYLFKLEDCSLLERWTDDPRTAGRFGHWASFQGDALLVNRATVSNYQVSGRAFFYRVDADGTRTKVAEYDQPDYASKPLGWGVLSSDDRAFLPSHAENKIVILNLTRDGQARFSGIEPATPIVDPNLAGRYAENPIDARGDLLAVGNPQYAESGIAMGAVLLYRRDADGTYQPTAKVVCPEPQNGARFGVAARFVGNALVVGAPGWQDGQTGAKGCLFLYDVTPDGQASLVERFRPQPPTLQTNEAFGAVLGVEDEVIAVTSSPTSWREQRATAVYFLKDNKTGPTITQQPADVEAALGAAATFTVQATGQGALAYQWRFNGAQIVGATNDTLTFTAVSALDAGSYTVEVTDLTGSRTSRAVQLALIKDTDGDGLSDSYEESHGRRFMIVTNSLNFFEAKAEAERRGGHLATFSTEAEWNLMLQQVGWASAAITAWAGGTDEATEGQWRWTTGEPWSFQHWGPGEPNNCPSCGGENHFVVDPAGNWRDNNGTNRVPTFLLEYDLELDPNNPDTDGDGYSDGDEVKKGSLPYDPSSTPGPRILEQPPALLVLKPGETATFAVQAAGQGTLLYQWHVNGVPLVGATNSTLEIPSVSANSEGSYTVAVTDNNDTVTGKPCRLYLLKQDDPSRRTATATPTLVNGFLVGVTVTDGGAGYSSPPAITILGGGGSGAAATAVVADGMVKQILVTDAGSGYTGTPVVLVAAPSGLPAVLQEGLVAYYPFDGDAKDASGNHNDGEVDGAVLTPDRFGVRGAAYSFDGQNDEISTSSAPLVNGPLTVSAWFMIADLGAPSYPVLSLADRAANRLRTLFIVVQRRIVGSSIGGLDRLAIGTSGANDITLANPTAGLTNQWAQLTVVLSDYSQGGVRFYINGVFLGSNTSSGDNVPFPLEHAGFSIGKLTGWDGKSISFSGGLDDVRIYNRALSADEVQLLYTSERPPVVIVRQPESQERVPGEMVTFSVEASGNGTLAYQWLKDGLDIPGATNATLSIPVVKEADKGAYSVLVASRTGALISSNATLTINRADLTLRDSLVAYYPLNGNADDESGNARDGQVAGAKLGRDRFGELSGAYSFERIGEHILVPGSMHPQGEATLTYSVWVRAKSIDTGDIGQAIINVGSPKLGGGFVNNTRSCLFLAHGRVGYVGQFNDLAFEGTLGKLTADEWHHIVLTKESRSLRLYLDGVLVESASTAPGQSVSVNELFIGWNGQRDFANGEQFIGALDDLRIYSRALTDSEARALFRLESRELEITQSPQDAAIPAGSAMDFTVSASGIGQLNHQWRFNGVNLAGATNTVLSITDAQANHAGLYTVAVSDVGGSRVTTPARLTVTPEVSVEVLGQGFVVVQVRDARPLKWRIEVSNDLSTWEDLGEPVFNGDLGVLLDSRAQGHALRFYQAVGR